VQSFSGTPPARWNRSLAPNLELTGKHPRECNAAA
jgi:hypothetical protein